MLYNCLQGGDWEERFEYHFLALFDMIVYGMKVGWTLQRADEQTKERWHMCTPVFYRIFFTRKILQNID